MTTPYTGPKLADHARMMELVNQLSPETRARIARRLDDRFHQETGAPRHPECCGDEVAHVVTDDSDDPEHVDDCPGCETEDKEPTT